MRYNKEVLRHYRNVVDQYHLATGEGQYELADVARWGMDRGHLGLSPEEEIHIHIDRLSEACRTDTITTPGGVKVRVRHCAVVESNGGTDRPTQKTFWAHEEDASPEFLIESLWQRHRSIGCDVRALKADCDHINEVLARRGRRPIQMSFDFDAPEPPAAAAGD